MVQKVDSNTLGLKELLYDFDVTLGEPFSISQSIYTNPLIVIGISTITLGVIERKIITATDGSKGDYSSEYVEGVGHWRGLWQPNYVQLDCHSYLSCFSLNGEAYFVNTDETLGLCQQPRFVNLLWAYMKLQLHKSMSIQIQQVVT